MAFKGYEKFEREVNKKVAATQSAMTAAEKDPAKLEASVAALKVMGVAGGDVESLIEQATTDIAARDTGKRKLRSRQMARMASMVGSIQPRTQAQTASLLSGGPSSSTLLG